MLARLMLLLPFDAAATAADTATVTAVLLPLLLLQIPGPVCAAAATVSSDWFQVRLFRVLRTAGRKHRLPRSEEARHPRCERGGHPLYRNQHKYVSLP